MTPVRSTPSGTPEPARLGPRPMPAAKVLHSIVALLNEADALPSEQRMLVLVSVRAEVERALQ